MVVSHGIGIFGGIPRTPVANAASISVVVRSKPYAPIYANAYLVQNP